MSERGCYGSPSAQERARQEQAKPHPRPTPLWKIVIGATVIFGVGAGYLATRTMADPKLEAEFGVGKSRSPKTYPTRAAREVKYAALRQEWSKKG